MNSIADNEKKDTIIELICKKEQCMSCGACVSVCPVNCIDMISDSEGFYSPKIHTKECIKCNKCRKVCPAISILPNTKEVPSEAYAFIYNNPQVLAKSSSGGAFSAISKWVIAQKGVVYGCVYDKQFKAVFRKAELIEDLSAMRGSKYVESIAWPVYSEIKKDLLNNKTVLFVGLPCQVAGLLATLRDQNTEKLITVDLLCHGVPSHGLFEEYMKMLAEKKGFVEEYNFREKKYWGWGSWGYFIYKKGNRIKEKRLLAENDYYYALYFKENNLRESCYRCPYATLPRISDITIGDFWRIDEVVTNIEYKKGVSLVLLNSPKAQDIYMELQEGNISIGVPIETAKRYNNTIMCPAKKPTDRSSFYYDVNAMGFEQAAKKYIKIKHISPIVARYIPKGVKNLIKGYLKK